jgi:autotransporter-associated beta strand protein
MVHRRKRLLNAFPLVVVMLFPASAIAQSGSWTTSATGTYNWSQAGNWQGGIVADGAGNTADFATAGLTGPMTISLDTPRTLGSLVFDNPTNAYGWTVSGSNPLTLSNSAFVGPTISVNNPLITATISVPLAGSQGLTTIGPGTLTLTAINSYSGGTNVQNGTVQVASDAALGTGNVTGAALGTVNFTGTTTTTKSFAMNFGTVAVAAGKTLTFNGSVVSSAFLDGAGTFATSATNGAQFVNVTATPSVAIVSNNAADQFVHFTNSGALAVALGINVDGTSTTVNLNGFKNEAIGAVIIGAGSQINASNFQSYGILRLNPALNGTGQATLLTNVGTAPLGFNAGSRTFIDIPANENPGFTALDLAGKNAVVVGGLFVNNGYVLDSSNGQNGSATVIADFGSLVKGNGFWQNTVITRNGGKFQAGNSPGAASFGRLVLGPGGVDNYVFAINDATGAAGPWPDPTGHVSGWGLIKAVGQTVRSTTTPGDFTWTATPNSRLTIALDTLLNPTTLDNDVTGPMDHFHPTQPYSWLAVQWAGLYYGPSEAAVLDAATSFDTGGFLNPIAGTFGWDLDRAGHTLSLVYAPSAIPEPSSLLLLTLPLSSAFLALRRKQ